MILKIRKEKKALLIISIILFLFLMNFFFHSEKEQIIEEAIVEKEEIFKNKTIQVDIKGAVKTPGVYEMDTNSRVQDLILKSGGLLENAYVNTINLSKKLEDEMVVIIYTNEEINTFLEEETRIMKQENTCVCPKVENNVCIKEATTNKPTANKEDNATKKVSLNNGTKEDFETLSGIGSSKANAIIEYRNEHGKFNTIEEIKNVSGIGDATFEKIKENLTL